MIKNTVSPEAGHSTTYLAPTLAPPTVSYKEAASNMHCYSHVQVQVSFGNHIRKTGSDSGLLAV